METRVLRNEEQQLVTQLLIWSGSTHELPQTAMDLEDGGMGTIRFTVNKNAKRRYGRDVIQASYIDIDDVTVLITLTEDNNGDLYELEFWKQILLR